MLRPTLSPSAPNLWSRAVRLRRR